MVKPKIPLILTATAVLSCTAPAAPIDAKTGHAGLVLGSTRSELKAPILQIRNAHETADTPWELSRPPSDEKELQERKQMERFWQTVEIKPPTNSTFGGIPIQTVTLGYLSGRLCIMWLWLDHGSGMSEHDWRFRMDVMVDGLVQKYGPASSPTPSRGQSQPDYRMPVMWEGDDVACRADIISAFTVTLMSKTALKAAEQEASRRIRSEEQQMKKQAKEVRDDL